MSYIDTAFEIKYGFIKGQIMNNSGKKLQQILIMSFAIFFAFECNSQNIFEENKMENSKEHKISLTIGDTILTAILYDNPTIRPTFRVFSERRQA